MAAAAVKQLRTAYRRFQADSEIDALLEAVGELDRAFGRTAVPSMGERATLKREDLRLICFDHLCS
jgi:hypothetical protein